MSSGSFFMLVYLKGLCVSLSIPQLEVEGEGHFAAFHENPKECAERARG
jgi:hypothetical protein